MGEETEDKTPIMPMPRCCGSLAPCRDGQVGNAQVLCPCQAGDPKIAVPAERPARPGVLGRGDTAPATAQPVHGSARPPTPHFTTRLINNSLWERVPGVPRHRASPGGSHSPGTPVSPAGTSAAHGGEVTVGDTGDHGPGSGGHQRTG